MTKKLVVQGAAGTPVAADRADFNYNLAITNVASLHVAGQIGQDVIIAVIDSGTANVPTIPSLAGRVIGGETFVPADPLSATHHENGSHGTAVAEMAAANGDRSIPGEPKGESEARLCEGFVPPRVRRARAPRLPPPSRSC